MNLSRILLIFFSLSLPFVIMPLVYMLISNLF